MGLMEMQFGRSLGGPLPALEKVKQILVAGWSTAQEVIVQGMGLTVCVITMVSGGVAATTDGELVLISVK